MRYILTGMIQVWNLEIVPVRVYYALIRKTEKDVEKQRKSGLTLEYLTGQRIAAA